MYALAHATYFILLCEKVFLISILGHIQRHTHIRGKKRERESYAHKHIYPKKETLSLNF